MIKEKFRQLKDNRLLVNSFYLMGAACAIAGFGFIFWAIIARSFADSQVGIAATLLSLSSLISLLSLAGFDTTFVRFLPKSNRRKDYTNSGLIIASGLSVVLSVVFLIIIPLTTPSLAFVTHTPLYAFYFIIFTLFTTLNTLTNAIFLAYRKALYTLIINVLFSLVKVILPFLFASGDAMLIFNIAGISQAVGVGLSFWVMWRKLGHVFALKVHADILRLSRKYSFAVYSSSILNLLPPTLLPLIVTNQIGPANSAYYYMTFTMASILYTGGYALMQSVFAESSHIEEHLEEHLKKAAKAFAIFMIPAIIVLVVAAPYILHVFGANYAREGTTLLQLFSLSGVFVAVYTALGTIFKVRGATVALFYMNVAYALTILGISYSLVAGHGLVTVGIGWLIGNVVAAIVGLISYKFTKARLKV